MLLVRLSSVAVVCARKEQRCSVQASGARSRTRTQASSVLRGARCAGHALCCAPAAGDVSSARAREEPAGLCGVC